MMPECVAKNCMSFATYYVATEGEMPTAFCEEHEQEYGGMIAEGLSHDEAVKELQRG